ncbi:MAG: GxxExxY protein [archaeon]
MKYEELTEKIIGAFYRVYDELGYGFLEKVYERALAVEFGSLGLRFERQVPINIVYRKVVVGDYCADFIVEGKVVVEIKAIRELGGAEEKQLLNYLRATDKGVGLLLNFGQKPEVKRKVYDIVVKKNVDVKREGYYIEKNSTRTNTG